MNYYYYKWHFKLYWIHLKKTLILKCHYYSFKCIIDQISAALESIRDYFKTWPTLTPNFWILISHNIKVCAKFQVNELSESWLYAYGFPEPPVTEPRAWPLTVGWLLNPRWVWPRAGPRCGTSSTSTQRRVVWTTATRYLPNTWCVTRIIMSLSLSEI